MSESANLLPFVAVLVFTDDGWRTLERRPFAASHPEIAYQLAIASGTLKDYGRQFLGLADLYIQTQGERFGGASQQGDAASLVVAKEDLNIFRESRWKDVPHDAVELENAFHEPAIVIELPGVDNVPWNQLTHAYGPAKDVARDLKRLASADLNASDEALGWLHATILHQGSVFDATVHALPFIVLIASEPRIAKTSSTSSGASPTLRMLRNCGGSDSIKVKTQRTWRI